MSIEKKVGIKYKYNIKVLVILDLASSEEVRVNRIIILLPFFKQLYSYN